MKRNLGELTLILLLVFAVVTGYATEYAKVTGEKIAKSVIRLHVVANSDSVYDQNLKLKVRDNVISYMSDLLKNAKSTDETREIILNNIDEINKKAKDTAKCDVVTELKKVPFPTKFYGDTSFPAGKYEALQIVIGKGEGKNWWCVLYPQLCINNKAQTDDPSDNSFARLSDESKEKLKQVLTPEEYEILSNHDKKEVQIKFKILEWINGGKDSG